MEDLLKLIQNDPELWEIVEKLKHQDQEPMEFITDTCNMLSLEFEELNRTDLIDKLALLFGGVPKRGYIMVAPLLHIALDMFILKNVPNDKTLKEY